ncbi:hypothetical protein [Marinicella litoralis]|uniref:Uncharacterized protein n=1 Tax=Marinicella litoralis TaxID=644220 RepID=A0A4R6XAW0_9GAMM|nr:hypothetical protein [Marinicella litoralis]TDR16345.1 hypothetical protein C8D91_2872 [Marinicella litoralis]
MKEQDLLKKVFEKTNATNQEYWLKQCDDKESAIALSMLFVRESLKLIQKPNQTEWLDATIKDLEFRIGRDDLYSTGFLPEKPNLLSAVKSVKESNVDRSALTHIIRESQKDVLYGMFSLLGGGHCFEDGLESAWELFEIDEDGKPKRGFVMMNEIVNEFEN